MKKEIKFESDNFYEEIKKLQKVIKEKKKETKHAETRKSSDEHER